MKLMNDWAGSGLIFRIEHTWVNGRGYGFAERITTLLFWCRCGNHDTVTLEHDDPLAQPGAELKYLRCDKCRAEWRR